LTLYLIILTGHPLCHNVGSLKRVAGHTQLWIQTGKLSRQEIGVWP